MTLIGFETDDAPRNGFPPVKPKAGGWCPAEAGVQPGWRVLGVSEGRHAPLFPVRLPQRQQLRSRFHGRARPAPSSLQRASRGLWRLCSLQRRSRERLGLRLFLRCRLSSSSSPRTGKRPDRSGEAAAEVSAVNGGCMVYNTSLVEYCRSKHVRSRARSGRTMRRCNGRCNRRPAHRPPMYRSP